MRVDSPPRKGEGSNFARLLADAFRQNGWKVVRETRLGGRRADLLVRHGKLAYAVELKSAPEGRRDRLIPILAKAVLQAQALVRGSSAVAPLAVVASARVPEALADEVRNFAIEYAPGVAVGVMDLEGFRAFVGVGLEGLNASRQPRPRNLPSKSEPQHHLFSDLNQWMLKVLLAPQVPEELLSAPRGEYRSASQLARAAGVSVMSAFRLSRQLQVEGFLETSDERIRLVRVEELMDRWRAAYLRPAREWPMRWVLRGDPGGLGRVFRLLESGRRGAATAPWDPRSRPSLRICLALFAAAEVLGVGVVHGVRPHIYVGELRPELVRRLGLMRVEPGQPPDVYVRIPSAPQSVFRGAVRRGDVLASDILQVWLDVTDHPARGRAQALEIERKVLHQLVAGKR
ncbi:MAG: hypothetical protein LAO51_12320 [Acidobacteriia bacterium]|nr:hypothetical protein [Terriglobia bacterium]